MHSASLLGHASRFLLRGTWNIQQGFDGEGNIRGIVQFELKWHLGVRNLFIKPFILILRHFPLLFVPDGLQAIDLLPIQPDRIVDELRELCDYFLNFVLLAEFSAVWFQFHDDLGASVEVEVLCG